MTSSVVEGGRDEGKHEPSDFITETMNLTSPNLSLLPSETETFLSAAISLKDKVRFIYICVTL